MDPGNLHSARGETGPTRRHFCGDILWGGAALVMPGAGPALASSPLARHFAEHATRAEFDVEQAPFRDFQQHYVSRGPDGVNRVAYARVSAADHRALKAHIAALEATNVTALTRDRQFAFWANLYNAVTIDLVLDAWPVTSILDIKPTWFSFGPWKQERVKVGGRNLSLDNIEHDILRVLWRDPRVHYALNCASIGCPNLPLEPLQAADLDNRLDSYAREYVNHPRGAAFDDRGRLTVSSIYKWYREDFGGTERGVIGHLARHARELLRRRLESVRHIARYEYDWSINAAAGDAGG